VPHVTDDPSYDGGVPLEVLLTAQGVLAGLAALVYVVVWARRTLGEDVEVLEADLRRETKGETHLPRLPHPWRLVGLGYLTPMLLSMLVLCLVDVPADALFATPVTVAGHVLVLLVVVGLGPLAVLPPLGLFRIVRGRGLRRHARAAVFLVLLLCLVPWAALGTWAAQSPYEGSRSPDWLLMLGIQRDGVEVRHVVALRAAQVLTYVVAALLASTLWLRRKQATDDDPDRPDGGPDGGPGGVRAPDAP
jgi:hypothetical protein